MLVCLKPNRSEHQFFKKLEEQHFGPILVPFREKTSKQDFSHRKNLSQL